jgi:hypothetical protein
MGSREDETPLTMPAVPPPLGEPRRGSLFDSMRPIDVDTGKLSISFVTFLLVLGGVATAAITWARMPTDASMKEAMTEHTKDETPHHAVISVLKAKIDTAASEASEAKRIAGDAKEDTKYIRGRIDFLTEMEMEQARGSTSGLRRARRAAQSVRKRSGAAEGSPNDPLSGVEGL